MFYLLIQSAMRNIRTIEQIVTDNLAKLAVDIVLSFGDALPFRHNHKDSSSSGHEPVSVRIFRAHVEQLRVHVFKAFDRKSLAV